jgi:hypothetical protein
MTMVLPVNFGPSPFAVFLFLFSWSVDQQASGIRLPSSTLASQPASKAMPIDGHHSPQHKNRRKNTEVGQERPDRHTERKKKKRARYSRSKI